MATMAAQVDAFVDARSTTFRVLLEDVAEESKEGAWRGLLPPPYSADVAGTEARIATLMALHAEPDPAPAAVFYLLYRPLFQSLAGCGAAAIADLRGLAEFLQLPLLVTERLDLELVAHPPLPDTSPHALKAAMAPPLHALWLKAVAPTLPACVFFRLDSALDGNHRGYFGGLLGVDTGSHTVSAAAPIINAPDKWRVWGRVAGGHALRDVDCSGAKEEGIVTCAFAARAGRIDVLRWAREQGCEWDERTCSAAAESGRLEVLQWARAQDPPCPWNEVACAFAAEGGQLEMLQWLRAQHPPCPWSEGACGAAANGGHVDVLQWLRAQVPPCPWDASTCFAAASFGHLEALRWARGQVPPCPWDEDTCWVAAARGHMEVLQWLRAQVPPCPWDVNGVRAGARNRDHDAIVAWLDGQG